MAMQTKTLKYWIDWSRIIAQSAHHGQTRRDGKTSYMTHIDAVTNAVEDRLKPIANLHDTVEDTPLTLSDLKNFGFEQYVIDAVDILTHEETDSNEVYWKKILSNPDAIKVKLADINHNINDNPTPAQVEKYNKALKLFAAAGYKL